MFAIRTRPAYHKDQGGIQMYNSLSKLKYLRPVVYIRVASKEQLVSPARNVKANQTNKSYAMAKQLMETKYDYQSLSKVHSLIKEKINKKY